MDEIKADPETVRTLGRLYADVYSSERAKEVCSFLARDEALCAVEDFLARTRSENLVPDPPLAIARISRIE